jgi:outer membrane protein OmpA-like peptidoglycan-associated protein
VRVNNAKEFRESKIPPSALNYHRNNLNIVGKRLQENPGSTISVQGFVDPKTEPGNCELAVRRATAVKAYLIKVYGIENDRIEILAENDNCYPKDRTITESQKGFQENRRVQISTNDPNLLFAVSNAQYQEPKFILPQTILMNIKANEIEATKPIEIDKPYPMDSDLNYLPAENWEIFVNQSGKILYENSEYSETAQIPFEIDRFNAASLTENNLDFELLVLDNKGGSEKITKSIPVRKDTLQNEVERLTLAVFEVSSAEVTPKIKREIQRFVKFLDENSQVNIVGYSDDIGNDYDNLQLSKIRAENVKNYIRQIAPRTKFGRVEGVGSSEFPPGLKSYDSPEERFISRTVEIEIRKRVE